jgi:glycine dehydrogenase
MVKSDINVAYFGSFSMANLPYNPAELPRELTRHYISATESEIAEMLASINKKQLHELYSHIPSDVQMKKAPAVQEELGYDQLVSHVEELAQKNKRLPTFIGDGLPHYRVPSIVPYVSSLRGLTTAYTPYQPERSQGTLCTLWLYSSTLSMLTGFEAINASLYDRSTALYEALQTAVRIAKKGKRVLVASTIYPGDLEVLETLAKETDLSIDTVAVDQKTGLIDQNDLAQKTTEETAAFAFAQVNHFGNLEDVNALTDHCTNAGIQAIGVIDPMLLANKGLLPPSLWGSNSQGCHMIVGEGQHLAIGPNFGGPGLGIFGIRFNDANKLDIRQTAGRFVGKARDNKGQEGLCMVLSTREQHIRREKATSNICSNQGFVATLAGAAVLARGEEGMARAIEISRSHIERVLGEVLKLEGISLAFPTTSFMNEATLEVRGIKASELLDHAVKEGVIAGVDISERLTGRELIKIFTSDAHSAHDVDALIKFFKNHFKAGSGQAKWANPASQLLRQKATGLPNFSEEELRSFYQKLADQNVSPDDNIYPLGSCTMKYNPHINDYAASLPGFTDIHPQAPESCVQGALEVLWNIQENFKAITGLPGLTTQPVAGAQGELVGLKLFQAYHRDRGNGDKKRIVLIPKSAHGTNPATATMAGLETKIVNGLEYGIVSINADQSGQVDFEQLKTLIAKHGERIAGIMVTNPNTSGIFETKFREMADLIHAVDGLVYMDGANMNAIAGWLDLGKMGVDAVHNNLHKTWTIPHGGGGPGDAIVAVSEKLIPYLPGIQVEKTNAGFKSFKAPKSIGSFHRHHGNFAHKVRCHTYLRALGPEGIRRMSAVAVLSSLYLFEKMRGVYPTLPDASTSEPRMHEFILTLSKETFQRIEQGGTPKAQAIARVGKLFLDFGLHAPTVAFPEQYGLMVEPTESFSKSELDRFTDILLSILKVVNETPEVLTTAPHFTPIGKVDEVEANKNLILSEHIEKLPDVLANKLSPGKLKVMPTGEIYQEILKAHAKARG